MEGILHQEARHGASGHRLDNPITPVRYFPELAGAIGWPVMPSK